MEKFSKEKEKNSYSFDQTSNCFREKSYQIDNHFCHVNDQKIDIIDKNSLLNEELSENESEEKYRFFHKNKNLLGFNESILSHLHINDSILDFFPTKESTVFYRLLHAPGDILGHIDLLNGQKYTETCKCITNTLVKQIIINIELIYIYIFKVWYLKSNDLIDLIERFNHLRILEKLWHYTALQIAEVVLYEYLNTLVC